MRTLILTIVLLLIALLLLGVKALFIKGGRFPAGHVHDLPQLQRKPRDNEPAHRQRT